MGDGDNPETNPETNSETNLETKSAKSEKKNVKNVILIPFKLKNPKTRLSRVLDLEERKNLAILMLSDVLESIKIVENVGKVIVAVPEEETARICRKMVGKIETAEKVEILVDERDLNDLVNYHISKLVDSKTSLAVIMADLPLLNPSLLNDFFNSKGEVVLSPGRKGGTNMILIRSPVFRVSYHYGSFMKHIEIAKSRNLSVEIFDSFYSSVDIDDESDLLELLIHGEGKKSGEYLKSLGYSVNCSNKDPKIEILR